MSGFMQQKHLHPVAPHRAALLTYPANLREALRQARADPAKTLFGTGHGIPSVMLIKHIAATKPDFVWLDVEHGMFNRLELHDAIQAINFHSEGRTSVVVRVPKHDEITLTTALDAGAAGIVIPHCESVEEIKEFVKEVYYPPIGHRSFSPWTFAPGISDASLYEEDAFNIATSNRHVAVIAQIESVKGVENVEEIAALENVHALLFGPGDFMADAGIPLKLGGVPHPTLMEAMGKFAAAGNKHGKPLMNGVFQLEMIPMMIQQGFRALVVFMDVWGISNLVAGNLAAGRGYAAEVAASANGNTSASNGIVKEQEKSSEVVTNGHEPVRA